MTIQKEVQASLAKQIQAGADAPGVTYDILETYCLYKHPDGSLTANILGLAVLGACEGNVEAALALLGHGNHNHEEIGRLLGMADDIRGRFIATVTILYPSVASVTEALAAGTFMVL